MSKIIIGIHGLGNKPPLNVLKEWWYRSICDGIHAIDQIPPIFKFELAYWASFIHPQSLDINEKNEENNLYIEDPYYPSKKSERGKPNPLQKRIRDYLEKQIDKLLLNEDLSINFSAISDFIIHHFFHDLEIYYTSNYPEESRSNYLAREAIREKLADTLRFHRKKEILLIAHSMGSIIAYDVLTQIVPDVKIDTFITCGSPLGIPVIMNKIRAEQKIKHKNIPLSVPENITRHWYNLSDLGDRVAINYNLADDFQKNSRNIEICDIQVSNTYEYKGDKNPHKSYGYLRTPEMSDIILEFLYRDRSRFMIWLTEKLYRLIHPGDRKGIF